MKERIRDLQGLGPETERWLCEIGVSSVKSFLASDPVDLYERLVVSRGKVSLNMLYAMVGAQEDVHWKLIAKDRKTQLLMQLDDRGLAPK